MATMIWKHIQRGEILRSYYGGGTHDHCKVFQNNIKIQSDIQLNGKASELQML